jgi:hypothetical protein
MPLIGTAAWRDRSLPLTVRLSRRVAGQLRPLEPRLMSVQTGRLWQRGIVASALVGLALAGCAHSTNSQGAGPQISTHTSHRASTKQLGCGRWAGPGSDLADAVRARYGDIDGCGSVANVWVMTTDEGSAGVGSIGYHLCRPSCASDKPRMLSQWRFVTPQGKPGTYSRLAGVNADGTILFVGGAGELSLNPATGALRKAGR